MSGVKIRVTADTRPAEVSLNRLDNSLGRLEQQGQKLGKTFRNVGLAIAGAFAASVAVKGITAATDSITNFNNKLATVTKSTKEQNYAFKELTAVSKRTRTSMDGNVTAFQRFSLSLESLGKTTPQVIKFTETFAKAGAVGGATADEISNSAIQLGQGLAAGALRGEELNSVLESNVVAARLIADEFGVGVGALKQLAADGELTADRIFKAFDEGAVAVNKSFEKMDATTDQLFTVMKDSLALAVFELDKVVGVSAFVRKALIGLTKVFDYVSNNVALWAVKAQLAFTIVKVEAVLLGMFIRDALTGLFDGIFDFSGLVAEFKTGWQDAKVQIESFFSKENLNVALDFAVEKYDFLAGFLPNIAEINGKLLQFTSGIKDIFHSLWKRIVGNSLWTGIWDPSHEEGGAASVGNIAALKGWIDPVITTIQAWAGKLKIVFKRLQNSILELWGDVLKFIEDSEIEAPTEAIETFKDGFNSAVDDMKKKYDELLGKLQDTEAYQAVSAAAAKIDKETGISETIGKAVTIVSDFIIDFDIDQTIADLETKLAELEEPIQAWKDAFFTVPLVVGVVELSKNILPDVGGLFDSINEAIEKNAALGGAIISVGLSAVLSQGFRSKLIVAAIGAGFIYAAANLGNNEAFLTSIKNTVEAWVSAFVDAMGEDGDGIVGRVITGIANILLSIGEGIAEGIFGEGVLTDFSKYLITALEFAAIAVLLSSAARKAFVNLGIGLVGYMWGVAATSHAGTAIGVMFLDLMGDSSLLGKSESLGKKLGTQIQTGLMIGVTVGLASLLANAIDYSVQSAIDGVGQLVTGASAEEQAKARADKFLEREDGGGQALAKAIDGGQLNLKLLDDDTLKRITVALNNTEESMFDYANGLNGLMFGMSSLEVAIDKLADVNSFKGLPAPNPLQKASGGYISGPGTGTSDSIPAMLSNGEYVIKASAVQSLGKSRLDAINQGILPKFASGGIVGQGQSTAGKAFDAGYSPGGFQIGALLAKIEQLEATSDDLKFAMGENTSATDENTKDKKKKGRGKKGPKDTRTDLEKAGDSYFGRFTSAFASGLSEAIKTGDFGSLLDSVLDTFTSTIIESFVDGLTEGLFKDGGPLDMSKLFENMFSGGEGAGGTGGGFFGNLLSNIGGGSAGGGGGFFGTLLSGLGTMFGGMAQGGTVPSSRYSQAGKDSVPTLLMPGEQVLSKSAVNNMNAGSNNQQQSTFNLNITGDVSRQTRQEIVRMMPQISGGVNANNRENNRRG